MSRKRNRQLVSVWFILAITTNPCGVEADWSEYVILAGTHGDTSKENLSIEQISEWRVRDIKRRLARSHGYSAAELGAMLDKRELINALAFEEEKQRLRENEAQRRTNVKQGIVVAISCIVLTFCWPLIQRAIQVGCVHMELYTDRKRLEVTRSWELRSFEAVLGVLLMFVVDALRLWLSVSIIASWIFRSKYFFPLPNLTVYPSQMMGSHSSATGGYGFNMAPMLLGWLFGFVRTRMESWTGSALSRAQKRQRRAARKSETKEEKAARREEKKEAKRRIANERASLAAAVAAMRSQDPPPPAWIAEHRHPSPIPFSDKHQTSCDEAESAVTTTVTTERNQSFAAPQGSSEHHRFVLEAERERFISEFDALD